ncbi:MAG: DUF814 domain-containing protein [Chlorobiaceae bacterium]|nr:DUF814 domain-containing protein [Chlorobiaceae bacterium]
MHRNYFTLYHAARELHEKLAGGRLDGLFTGEKEEVVFAFTTAEGNCLQLFMATGSMRLGIFTREGPCPNPANSTRLLKACAAKPVQGVSISPTDREIAIRLENNESLVLQLFGLKSNILFVRDNVILDAFRDRNEHEGRPVPAAPPGEAIIRTLEKLALDKRLFLERLASADKENAAETISAVLPGFDRSLAKELLRRAGEGSSPETLFDCFRTMFYEMLEPEIRVVEKQSGEPAFSILSGTEEGARTFGSMLEGLSFYSISMLRFLRTKEELKRYRSQLLQKLGKKKRELAAFDPGMIETLSREYETCGHLLMASLGMEGRGRERIAVDNFFEPGSPEKTIELKPVLTLRENAGSYFSKAAKTRARLSVMKERRLLVEKEVAEAGKALEDLEKITSPKDARRFLDEHGAKKGDQDGKKTVPPFRSVRISPNATLFIGKNAENNDLLTFGYAKPGDIWLHARGTSGSHCVLKGSGPDHLDDIRKAASIAAWHSSAKHSELVPVIYTQKKYVRRSRKSAPGQVIVEREKVLFVKPARETD